MTGFEDGLKPIPSAALSTIDAAQLRACSRSTRARVRLALDCGIEGDYTAERDRRNQRTRPAQGRGGADGRPPRFLGDPGTGAIDDAAGVAIGMAAGALLKPLHPQRTIRVVAFANEERGLFGGRAYAAAHAKEVGRHQIVSESDFGAGRIYSFNSNAPDSAKAAIAQIAGALKPLGIDVDRRRRRAGIRRGPDRATRRDLGLAQPRRHALLRLPPQRRGHARQDRPERPRPERRRLRGVRVARGAGGRQLRQRAQARRVGR